MDESHILELEIQDPDDPSDEPETMTVRRIAHIFLEEMKSDSGGEMEKLNRVGFWRV
ncbi:MAG: hypothetical protein J5855_05830 [Mailhella sp.]|nr:hypothetical protein [Mailhella sp.]